MGCLALARFTHTLVPESPVPKWNALRMRVLQALQRIHENRRKQASKNNFQPLCEPGA
jgi:hypothetical protein